MKNFSVVGKNIPRPDAKAKVTGQAQFTDDIKFPGMLYGKILRSPVAHARIVRIDTSKAKRLPGVKAVITGEDTPKINFGNWRLVPESMDEYPLAIDKVRFVGDEVAAVAAIDEDIAEEALSLIEVEYEELPAYFDVDSAMAEGAVPIHENVKNNISLSRKIDYGDLEKAFKEADYIREDWFTVHAVSHAYMEPCSCVAKTDLDGRITIWTSTQTPYFVQCLLARTLGMRENDIRVIKPFVGGGFGGKMEMRKWEFCAAFISKLTGKPVKFTLSRQEELMAGRRRHGMKLYSKVAFKKDGTILGKEFKAYLDGGAYNSMGPTAAFLCGNFGGFLYKYPSYRYEGYHVYTNKPPAGAMRGFGAPQSLYVTEVQMNMAAEDLGIDPIDLRLKNAMETGYEIPGVAKIHSCGFKESLERVRKLTDWDRKRKEYKKHGGKGIGVGCYSFISGGAFNWFNTQYPFSAAEVRVFDDGTAHLLTMAADIGQGCDLVLRQILAEELGIRVEDIRLTAADTAVTPQADLGTWGSRVTFMVGNAVINAARKIKEELFKVVSLKFNANVIHDMECKNGRVYLKNRPDRGISFAEAVRLAQKYNRGEPLRAYGSYVPRGHGLVSPAFSFGAQVIEVEVDKETGIIEVKKATTVHDCGTEINPMAVQGQLEGSIQMGLGYATCEQFHMKDGKTLNTNFLDYKIPTALDMPESESYTVETYDPYGPYGAKEAGEGLVSPTAPAIEDAVYMATGVRIKDLPITPEKILRGLGKIKNE